MSDYNNATFRFVNLGQNIRDDPDKVGEGSYTRLKNVGNPREASFSTRKGRTLSISTGLSQTVHTIDRLDNSTLVIGAGTRLYRNGTQYPTSGYSGNFLSTIIFRPAITSTPWMYVADTNQLRKVRADGTDYKWGITAPISAAGAVAFGSGNLDSSVPGAIVYDWRYTYYASSTGTESNPSPIMSSGISVVGQQANVVVAASSDPQVDTIRLYRRGGTQPNSWNLTASSTNASGTITDNNSDSSIALSLQLELDNYVPFTSIDSSGNASYEVPLPYIWGPFLGKYILACGDDNRPGFVYWTNAERPDSSDIANNTPVAPPTERLLGGFIYSSTPFVWSNENLYALDFGGPASTPKFVPRKTPVGYGIAAPGAFAVGPLVWFVSPHGLYETDCQSPAVSISEVQMSPIFNGQAVEDLNPIDFSKQQALRLFYAEQKLHLIYQDAASMWFHLTFHTLYRRWVREDVSIFNETIIYHDQIFPSTATGDVVYIGSTIGNVYTQSGTTDDGVDIDVNIRTGSQDFGQPQTNKEFGNVIFDVDPNGGSISITPYLNAEASSLPTQTVSGSGRAKFPLSLSDTYAYSIAFDLSWSGVKSAYQYEYLWRPDEEEIKHWEFPETSHGIPGWQHLRDIYLSYRATAPITLTLTIDGVAYAYPNLFPSTSGGRRKNHAFLSPVKGKVFRYALDSEASFRLYGEDCEVRVKPWLSSLGYQLISPFIESTGGT